MYLTRNGHFWMRWMRTEEESKVVVARWPHRAGRWGAFAEMGAPGEDKGGGGAEPSSGVHAQMCGILHLEMAGESP